MICILCQKEINDDLLYCDSCYKNSLNNIITDPAKISREGQLLSRVVKKKYKILGQFFRDTLSISFRSIYLAKNREDCLSVLPFAFSRTDEVTKLFHINVKKWISLKHKNLIKPIGSGKQGKLHFSISPFPKGIRLSKILEISNDLSMDWTLLILKRLSETILIFHKNKLVHGNIKPSSIFISQKGEIHLGCIGLISPYPKEVFRDNIPSAISLYSSPEQLKGEKATIQSDLYSLSLIGYKLLTGINPFDTEKEINILYKNLHEAVIPVLALNADIPVELSDIITKNLGKDQLTRSSTVNNFLTCLNQVKATLPKKPQKKQDDFGIKKPDELIQKGKEFYSNGRYKKALEYWNNYLQIKPNDFAVQQYVQFANERLAARKISLER